MGNRHLTDQQLDEAIDRVAREMMDRDADGGFRARLMARVATTPRVPRSVGRLAWAAGLAVLVLAVAMGLWMARRPQPTPASAQTAAVGPGASPSTGPLSPTGSQESVIGRTAAPGPAIVASNAAPSTQTGAAEDRYPESGPAPLVAPHPINLVSIDPAALAITDIGVEPIGEIAPITITPTTAGSGEPQRRELR